MRVYFSGISGTGIGPLAEMAHEAGCSVCGSDLSRGAISAELEKQGIECSFGAQDGQFLRKCHDDAPIDWFVYSSALPADHPELVAATELGIHCSKRDEFLADFIKQKDLKMIAIAGTHGKTTTTAMLVWAFLQLHIPCSYLVGTTLGWANGGNFDKNSKYFIYEADEYDRNFLAYEPYIAAITCVDYDHPDIYPTLADYQGAFTQFESQSKNVVKNTTISDEISLVGKLRKQDASIALAVLKMIRDEDTNINCSDEEIITALNNFPGAGRRFEEIATGVFSDYGHHPNEIKATVAMAREFCEKGNFSGLAVVYQPHQNTRQHKVRGEYVDAFIGANKIFWLPTYLTREDPNLAIISPDEFIAELKNSEVAEAAEMNDELAITLQGLQKQGWIILLLSAGPADAWFRKVFTN